MKKRLFLIGSLLLVLVVLISLASCKKATPTPAPTPVPTATPVQTATSVPTATPTATTPVKPIELTFSAWYPTTTVFAKYVDPVFIQELEKRTNGRVKVNPYWAEAVAKALQTWEATASGVADISMICATYYPDRCPGVTMVELPFFFKLPGLSMVGSSVLQTLYNEGYYSSFFKDIKPLWFVCQQTRHLHTNTKFVKTLEDLKGMVIRVSGDAQANAFKALGVSPVFLPGPEIYTALQRGTVEGTMWEWEGVKAWKVDEVTKYHTEIGLDTSDFVYAMNINKFNSLPSDIQKVINDLSGDWGVQLSGKAIDDENGKWGKYFKEEIKVPYYTLPDTERNRWIAATANIADAWIAGYEAKGIPLRKTYERGKELAQIYWEKYK